MGHSERGCGTLDQLIYLNDDKNYIKSHEEWKTKLHGELKEPEEPTNIFKDPPANKISDNIQAFCAVHDRYHKPGEPRDR